MKYLAIDFDDTIMNYKTEQPLPGCQKVLQSWKDQGCFITVFTNRMDQKYTWIRDWLNFYQIPYDRIICGKPFYDLYIDDRAVKFEGWEKKYR